MKNIDINSKIKYEYIEVRPLLGWTAQKRRNQELLRAVASNNLDGVIQSLEKKAEINASGKIMFMSSDSNQVFKGPPLELAVALENLKISVFLIEQGASFDFFKMNDFDNFFEKSDDFKLQVGCALIRAGWRWESENTGPMGDCNFAAYDDLHFLMHEESHPHLFQEWRRLILQIKEKDNLEASLPSRENIHINKKRM